MAYAGEHEPLVTAMHMSDGLVNASTSLLFAAVAAVVLGLALVKARADLGERTATMAGLVTAFVFAAQMINFPILPGASGHLLGGTLAAILVGPWAGSVCLTIVLLVQALLFADGGITALGTNITNMAVIGVFVGYGVAVLLRRLARGSRTGLLVTAFTAAFASTVTAALGFVLEYAIGGAGGTSLGSVFALMTGMHALIGIGEGIITAVTVGAVAAARPDLVYLLRGAHQSRAKSEPSTPDRRTPISSGDRGHTRKGAPHDQQPPNRGQESHPDASIPQHTATAMTNETTPRHQARAKHTTPEAR